jgi:hypothetical protein
MVVDYSRMSPIKREGELMTTIHIDVKNGKITCGTNGGHVRARHGTAITWTSKGTGKKFELEFSQLGVETAATASASEDWPFDQPAGPEPGPTDTFTGTLKKLPESAGQAPAAGQAPVYKYNVRVGDLLLDPIIIVDR